MTRAVILLVVLMCVLFATQTLALRASPAQIIIPQDSNGIFSVRVLDVTDPTQVTVQVSGDFSQNIALNENELYPDGGVRVSGTFTIPDDATPGDHVQELIIGTIQPASAGTVSARTELAIPIIARIPYPDAYLVANWNVAPDPGSDTSLATITLENRGRVSVTPNEIALNVLDDNNFSVLATELTTGEIAPGTFLRRETTLHSPQEPGVYLATLYVSYAQTAIEETREITLGSPRIILERVAYDTTERGAIIPVDVSGSIAWNRPLLGTVTIFFDENTYATTSANVTFTGGPFTQRVYVDTVTAGKANASVRAIVTAGVSSAERTDIVAARLFLFPQLEGRNVLFAIVLTALTFLLATLAIFGWWRRGVRR